MLSLFNFKSYKILLNSRSSHGVSVVGDTLYIFGGEHSARNPIGAELNCIDLKSDQPKWTEVEVEQAPLAR